MSLYTTCFVGRLKLDHTRKKLRSWRLASLVCSMSFTQFQAKRGCRIPQKIPFFKANLRQLQCETSALFFLYHSQQVRPISNPYSSTVIVFLLLILPQHGYVNIFELVILGTLRTATKFMTTTSVDRERTGRRTSVSAGKRKLKMQSIGRSTTTLNVNKQVEVVEL